MNTSDADNVQTKKSACSNCVQTWHKGGTYQRGAFSATRCLHIGKTPEQREEEAGAALEKRKHMHEPQVTSAPAGDICSPQPKYQARKECKGLSPTDGGGAGGMGNKAAALRTVAEAGSADVPVVLKLGKGQSAHSLLSGPTSR